MLIKTWKTRIYAARRLKGEPVLLADQITDIGNETVFKHQNLQMLYLKLKQYMYFVGMKNDQISYTCRFLERKFP